MARWRTWLGAALVAQLVSAPVYAQWDAWSSTAPPPPPVDDGVWVDVRSSAPVQVERVQGDVVYPVCAAPCRQKVPRGGVYRIGGPGVVPSANFDLTEEPWGVTLDVHPAPAIRQGAGLALGIVGVAMLVAGSSLQTNIDSASLEGTPTSHKEQVATDVLVLSGLGVGVIGLVLLLTSHTRVTSSNGVSF